MAQDYRDMEVIVVDDGSNDGSREKVKDLPVQYIWKENGGISSARNFGIEVSQGEYIAFLDVDDIWMKGKLSAQITGMEATGCSLCYTDEIWIRNGMHLNQKKRHKKYSGSIFEKCLPLCIISPSSVVIKRDVFEKVGKFDESMPVCEDYDMWLRISAQYPVLFLEKPFITKRGGHADQLSRRYAGMDRFRIESIARVLDTTPLTGEMHEAAVDELERKCRVYAKGAIKRGRYEEARHYLDLVKRHGGVIQIDDGCE